MKFLVLSRLIRKGMDVREIGWVREEHPMQFQNTKHFLSRRVR